MPKLTVITRKAYGGAYDVMSSKHIRADMNFAYPARGDRGDGPRGRGRASSSATRLPPAADPAAARARYVAEYREKFANPFAAAALGYLDEVIRPRETRPRLCRALAMLANKRQQRPARKHGNIPL